MITLDKEISHQFYSNSRNHPPTTIKGENEPFQLLLLLYFLFFPSLLLRSVQKILKGSVSPRSPTFALSSPVQVCGGCCFCYRSDGIQIYITQNNGHTVIPWERQKSVVRTVAHEIRNRRVQKIPRKPQKRPTIRLGNDNSNPTTRTT